MLQTYGGEALKKSSSPVTVFDRELADLASYMIKANRELNGIGLAAVQIGVHKRLVVLEVPQSSMGNPPTPGELQLLPQMPVVIVNPEILEFSSDLEPYDEGCLSVAQCPQNGAGHVIGGDDQNTAEQGDQVGVCAAENVRRGLQQLQQGQSGTDSCGSE